MRTLAALWIAAHLLFPSLPTSTLEAKDPLKPLKVYKPGKHIVSPVLLPDNFSSIIDPSCHRQIADDAQFALIVDPMGMPRNIIATRPAKTPLAALAAEIASRDRFSIGEKGEKSVPVSITLDIHLEGCISDKSNASIGTQPAKLAAMPLQTIGPPSDLEPETLSSTPESSAGDASSISTKGISAPVPKFTPEAKYSIEARRKRIQGLVLVSVIVDVYGNPQNPRIIKSLGYGLDEAAIDAVNSYRFNPAMKEGHAVPVMMTIQVNFRLR